MSYQPEGDWEFKLFRCCSDKQLCCMSCLCPCIVFGQVADIVNEGKTPAVANGIGFIILSIIAGPCLISAPLRTKLRKQYNLKGSAGGDCLIHCFCEPCALTQEYHELQKHGFDPKLGWKGNLERKNPNIATAPAVPMGMQR